MKSSTPQPRTDRGRSGRAQTLTDPSAPSALEYAILVVLMGAIAVATWKTFGEEPRVDPVGETLAP